MQKDKLLKLFDLLGVSTAIELGIESNAEENNIDLGTLQQAIDSTNLKNELADYLEGLFTEEELDALIAFYSTPAAQSAATKSDTFEEASSDFINNYVFRRMLPFITQPDNGGNTDPNDSGNGSNGSGKN